VNLIKIKKFVLDNAPEGEEAAIPPVTMGMVKDFIKKNAVYFREDFSAWENVGYKLSKVAAGLQLAAGTPKQVELQKEVVVEQAKSEQKVVDAIKMVSPKDSK
jgi:hypothetical protein